MGIRFAPSPTGQFHLGNLRTAWVSHQFARALKLPWVVRFEDIDGPRVLPGAQEHQLRNLADLGLVPDILAIQSRSYARHLEVFELARHEGRIYPCTCSRKEVLQAVEQAASAPHAKSPVYGGHCRNLPATRSLNCPHPTLGWRFRDPDPSGARDFLVGRTDPDGTNFNPSYNWACAIDDWDGNYTLLVRAWDLDHVADQQRAIQHWLAERSGSPLPPPAVFHCSLVTGNQDERLEKRTRGVTLEELSGQGIMPETLIRLVSASFDHSLLREPAPGALLGEARRKLSLSELGL